MNKREQYNTKMGTVEGALNLIKSGDTIAASIYGSEPTEFIKNLHTIADRVEGVTLWTMLLMGEYPIMQDVNLKGKIDIITFFYNKDCRMGHESKRYQMVPTNLSAVAETTIAAKRPNVYVVTVSPMDQEGNVHISFDIQASLEWLETADTVIFEINDQVPFWA